MELIKNGGPPPTAQIQVHLRILPDGTHKFRYFVGTKYIGEAEIYAADQASFQEITKHLYNLTPRVLVP